MRDEERPSSERSRGIRCTILDNVLGISRLPRDNDDLLEMTKQKDTPMIAKDCVAMPGVPNASIARQGGTCRI